MDAWNVAGYLEGRCLICRRGRREYFALYRLLRLSALVAGDLPRGRVPEQPADELRMQGMPGLARFHAAEQR